jgi:hypothetical protein
MPLTDRGETIGAAVRVAACTLALSPIRDTLIEGFSHFVTSMTAPIASGWSRCRVGLTPTGKRRLSTAHAMNGLTAANRSSLRARFGYGGSGDLTRDPAMRGLLACEDRAVPVLVKCHNEWGAPGGQRRRATMTRSLSRGA